MVLPIFKTINGKYVIFLYGSKKYPFKSRFVYYALRGKNILPLFDYKPLGLLSKRHYTNEKNLGFQGSQVLTESILDELPF